MPEPVLPPINYGIFALNLLGDELGEVKGVIQRWACTDDVNGLPTLTIEVDPTASARAGWLRQCELALRWQLQGEDDWHEEPNCRFVIDVDDVKNRLADSPFRELTFVGIGRLLRGGLVFDRDTPVPGLGAKKPLRRYAHCSPGRPLVDRIDAIIERATAAGLPWVIDHDFSTDHDSNDVTWPDQEIHWQFRIQDNLLTMVEQIVASGEADWRMNGRDLQLFVADTEMAQDLSASVMITDQMCVEAPERRSYAGLAGTALVIGWNGQSYVVPNPTAVNTMGYQEVAVEAEAAIDQPTAEKYARAPLRLARNAQEEITRKIDYYRPGTLVPHKDYPIGAYMLVQRGALPDEPNEEPQEPRMLRLTAWSIEWTRDSLTANLTFGDRLQNRYEAAVRRAARAAATGAGGWGGIPDDPGDDPREPLQVTGLTGEFQTEMFYGQAHGSLYLTWDEVTEAVPSDYDPDGDPTLKIAYYAVQKRRGAGGHWVHYVNAPTGSDDGLGEPPFLLDDKFDTTTNWDFRVAAVSHTGVRGNWSDVLTLTVDGDEDPRGDASLVYDGLNRSMVVRQARQDDAGAGFAFVAEGTDYVGEFSATSPLLRYGTGEPTFPFKGRIRVRAGENYWLRAQAKKVGAGTAVGRLKCVFRYDDATTATQTAQSATVGTSYAVLEGKVSASKDGTMDVQFAPDTLDSGTTLRVKQVEAKRQSSSSGYEDASFTLEKFIDRVLTGVKIQLQTILGENVADRTIAANHIVANSLTANEIAAHTITAAEIAALTITASEIATDAITTSKIIAGAVTNGEIDDDAVDGRTVAANAIGTIEIAANVDIDGTLTTTGGSCTVGGFSADQINMAGGAAIQDGGGGGMNFTGGGSWNFHDDLTYTGTIAHVSERASKTNIKRVSLERAKALLGLTPVTFKRSAAWSRKRGEQHVEAREWIDPTTKRKRRRKARTIPGKVDRRTHVGLIAEDVEAAGLSELVSTDSYGSKGIDYTKVPIFLLPLVQDLYGQVEALTAEVQALRGSN